MELGKEKFRKARHTNYNNDATFWLGIVELWCKCVLGNSTAVEKAQIQCVCPIKYGTCNLFQQRRYLSETICQKNK